MKILSKFLIFKKATADVQSHQISVSRWARLQKGPLLVDWLIG